MLYRQVLKGIGKIKDELLRDSLLMQVRIEVRSYM